MADERQRADEVEAGQRVYTPLMLRVYDLFVLGFSNRFVWRCRSSKMLERYDSHVGARHLDVGVGTGWFLDHCRWTGREPADHPARPERELTVGGVRPDPPLCARDGSGERVGASRPRRCALRLDRGQLPLPLSSRRNGVEGSDGRVEPPSLPRFGQCPLRKHDSRPRRRPQPARTPSNAPLQPEGDLLKPRGRPAGTRARVASD